MREERDLSSPRSLSKVFLFSYQTVTKDSLIGVSFFLLFFFKFFNNTEPEFPFPAWPRASGQLGVCNE